VPLAAVENFPIGATPSPGVAPIGFPAPRPIRSARRPYRRRWALRARLSHVDASSRGTNRGGDSFMEPLRPADPRRISSYDILNRLGAGGMGQVYLGRSPSGRRVAV